MPEILFHEVQKIKTTKIWMIVIFSALGPLVLLGGGVIFLLYIRIPFSWAPIPSGSMLIIGFFAVAFAVSLPVLLYFSKLEIQVKEDGVCFRFIPFLNNFKKIKPEEIDNVHRMNIDIYKDNNFYGIRYSFRSRRNAYYVKGDTGIQLVLKNGRKILLGTQKPDELTEALNKIVSH